MAGMDDVSSVYAPVAKEMGERYGMQVPTVFSAPERELDAAMRRSAVVEHSYFGRVKVSGKDALDFLHRLSTNDLLKLRPGSAAETVFTNAKGRIIDYTPVAVRSDHVLLLTSPGNQARLTEWLSKYHVTEDIRFEDITASSAMCSIVGPHALDSIRQLLKSNLKAGQMAELRPKWGAILAMCLEAYPEQIVHIIGSPSSLAGLWRSLLEAQADGITPMGAFAYDAYRISRGIPAIGGEISEEYTPLEVGLKEAVSFSKGCYIGQEVIARLDTYQKVHRRRLGLALSGPARQGGGQNDLVKGGKVVGKVTSWLDRQIYNRYLGLGIVESSAVREGDSLQVESSVRGITAVALSIPMLVGGGSHA